MTTEPRPFGFRVHRVVSERLAPPPTSDEWRVRLPHQCQSWDIAGEEGDGEPHADAVAALEWFIAEAQEALTALRERREIGVDW